MKRSILLFTSFAAIASVTLMSYSGGPAAPPNSLNRTGGPGSGGMTCSQSSCHGTGTASPNTTVQLTLIKEKLPPFTIVTKYTPGKVYEVSVSGVYAGGPLVNPSFGYQIMMLDGDQDNAGTISAQAGQPGSPATRTVSSKTIFEHTSPAASGNGSMTVTFDWTAPTAGTGTVTMYACFNAVDKDGINNVGDEVSAPFQATIPEQTTSVSELSEKIRIAAYPNPVVDNLNLKFEDAEIGNYTVSVLDLRGAVIHTEELNIRGSQANASIATQNWAAGTYLIRVVKDGAQRVIAVTK